MTTLRSDTISGLNNDGTVFEGDITFDSLNYMTLPKGTTNQRVNSAGGRAVIAGGYNPSLSGAAKSLNTMVYISIQTTGNALDFGDLSFGSASGGSCGSVTRGLVGASYIAPAVQNSLNNIDYFTIATTGNGADFGDLTVARRTLNGGSNSIRGIFAGGQNVGPSNTDNNCTNTIDYITIASTGNAADFGDLTTGDNNGRMNTFAPGFSSTRGVWPGGQSGGGTAVDTMEYNEIATLGNAVEFGEVADSTGRTGPGGFSNAHGGL